MSPATTATRRPGRLLLVEGWLLHLVTLGVLAQAVLAGQFLSGVATGLLSVHEITANAVFVLALAHTVLSVVIVRRGGQPWRPAVGSGLLTGALFFQVGLGYMPMAAATAIHIPLGVAVFGGAVWLEVHRAAAVGR